MRTIAFTTQRMKDTYQDLQKLNEDLIGEYTKRATNHDSLMKALKKVNDMIQRASNLRIWQSQDKCGVGVSEGCEEGKPEETPSYYQGGRLKLGNGWSALVHTSAHSCPQARTRARGEGEGLAYGAQVGTTRDEISVTVRHTPPYVLCGDPFPPYKKATVYGGHTH